MTWGVHIEEGVADSIVGSSPGGAVLGTGAAQVIAQIVAGNLPRGVYRVKLVLSVANPIAQDWNNMSFRGIPQPVAQYVFLPEFPRITLDGLTPLQVLTIAAGSAGAGYMAEIIATRLD